MERTINIFRIFFLTACGVGGFYIVEAFSDWSHWVGTCLGLVAGLFVILIDRLLKGVSLRAFSSATFGLILGCGLGWLLTASRVFQHASEDAQWIIHLIIYMVFGYLGMMLALRSNKEEFSLIIPYVRFQSSDSRNTSWVVDTSAVVDGRVADLVRCGFIEGTVNVPRYVLEEVKRLAMDAVSNVETVAQVGWVKLTGGVAVYSARIREMDREAQRDDALRKYVKAQEKQGREHERE